MPELPVLSTRDLNRALLARQLLLQRSTISPVEAIGQLGGMQAQEPSPPFAGLWTRLAGFEARELRTALLDRTVVRATLMRGTLHLLPAADYQALRGALQPVLDEAVRVLGKRAEGLDVPALLPVAREILADGPLTFNELRPRLQERFPAVDDRALGYAVRTNLPLVLEATEDPWAFPRDARFGLAESLLKGVGEQTDALLLEGPTPSAEEELVRRYLRAFGPASPADFATWSGLRKSAASATFARLGDGLERFADDRGRELFDLPDAPRPGEGVEAPVRLVPEFDNLLLGHDDRRRIILDGDRPALVTKNLRVRATYLVDGFAAGTWSVARTETKATLELQPFAKTTKKALAPVIDEAERLLAFMDAKRGTRAVVVGARAG